MPRFAALFVSLFLAGFSGCSYPYPYIGTRDGILLSGGKKPTVSLPSLLIPLAGKQILISLVRRSQNKGVFSSLLCAMKNG
jgi:hypothetical protein